MTVPDPTPLYRLRDGVYAPDLLVVAVAELDLFSWLSDREGASTVELCAHFELDPRPVDVLATYCTAAGLLHRYGDLLSVTELASHYLVAGSPYDLRAYYASLAERPACAELLSVLRTGEPAAWASASTGGHPDWAARLGEVDFAKRITSAMDARGAYLGPGLAQAVADLEFARGLDIGGSSGAYLCSLLDRRPAATGSVFERPPVDEAAKTLLLDRGYVDRVRVVTGDMFVDALPEQHDLHLFSHVLHDWDEALVYRLLAASYDALPPGGWLLDHDMHIDERKSGPLPVAEYSVLLMHSTPGKCWSVGELSQMLTEIGFAGIEHRPAAGDRSVLIARKPAG
jgi:SAM-dependent methyltransferase